MNTKFCIVLIFASIILSNGLRTLEASTRSDFNYKCNLNLNGEEVIIEGNIELHENLLCIIGGTPANSIELKKIPVINGKRCFPYSDFKYIDNNFSKLRKVLYFNTYSIEGSSITQNIRVEIEFTDSTQTPEDLEIMFTKITEDLNDSKIKFKKGADELFRLSNEYNALVVRFATGLKSRPEIEREIAENQVSIDAADAELNKARIRYNDHQADCTTSDAEREEALANLRNKRAKLENLLNTIYNNRQSIKSYEEGLFNKERAVAACRKVRDAAHEVCNSTITTLKEKLPTEIEDLNEVDTEINAELKGVSANVRIQEVNKLIDEFVNVTS